MPLGGEVEQIPLWVDGIAMARVLPRFGRGIEEFGAPEVADRFAVALEHIQHGPLAALRVLAEVVAVLGGARRGQQLQPPPAALMPLSPEARQWGPRAPPQTHPPLNIRPRAPPPRGRRTAGSGLLEDVVLRNDPAGRQFASGSGYRFGNPAQLSFLLKQPVARCSVL